MLCREKCGNPGVQPNLYSACELEKHI
jgi:hypothetical protein